MSSTIVNLSASPTDPNAGNASGSYPYNPVSITLAPGTYLVDAIGIADGGVYDAYTVKAPSSTDDAYKDGLWGFTFDSGGVMETQFQTNAQGYDSASAALAANQGPLTVTVNGTTIVSFFLNDSGYPYFADDSGGVSLQVTQICAPPAPPALPSTIVNLSADPTDPNAGQNSGTYAYNPVEVLLGPGTYQVQTIGIAQGGAYDAYTVKAPSSTDNAYKDGNWGFSFTSGGVTQTQDETNVQGYETAQQALAGNQTPLTFTLTSATEVAFYVNDSGYPYFADDSGGVSLQVTQICAPPTPPAHPSTIVNVSADPTEPNAGQNSGTYAYNPVEVLLGPGTYQVQTIGIAQGGAYDAYTVKAPSSTDNAYKDGNWGFSFTSGGVTQTQDETNVQGYETAQQALAGNQTPLTFTLTSATEVAFYVNDSGYPYFADDSGGVSLQVTQICAPPTPPAHPSTIVNLSADPTDPSAGQNSGTYAYNPVEVLLGPGTYQVQNIGIAQGGAYDAYSVYAPSGTNEAYKDGLWGFSFNSGNVSETQNETNQQGYDTAQQALAGNPTPLTFTLTSATEVAFYVNDSGYPYFADDSGGVSLQVTQICAPCFLQGTRLRAGAADVAVEQLAVGDLVTVRAADGTLAERPIKWIGYRRLNAADRAEIDRFPVRIRADAFSAGVPRRDVLVTSDHCVHVDGGLIPARMLVNGRSIIADETITSYTVYHVELEEHAILLADDLPVESYLDTGNRHNFANTDRPTLHPHFAVDAAAAGWARAAAPLTVDRATVEPIWRRLDARARAVGFAATAAAPTVTDDPMLRLVTPSGWRIRPSEVIGDRYTFIIPPGVTALRLASRAARPSETVGPFLDDRRLLGVMVGEITMGSPGARRHQGVQAHLTQPAMDGWHGIEGAARWTDGDAALPIGLDYAENRALSVSIQVLAAGPYTLAPAATLARAA